jgi:hypothetical protein
MPKNNHHCAGITSSVLYNCPCGFSKMCNDKKTSVSCMKRHIRFCSIGKEITETEVYLQNNEYSCDNSKVKTTMLVAPKEAVATFKK